MRKPMRRLTALLLVSAAVAGAAQAEESKARPTVTIEGVAVAKGQPLVFAKRAAWTDAMRTLAEQVLGVEFVLDTDKPGSIKYTVKGNVAPAGSAKQVSAESLPTGIYRIALSVEIEPAAPQIESLPEVTAEGKSDIAANRSLAAARTAAKAMALAEAVKKVSVEESSKTKNPIPRRLEGHAYYLGPVSERIEGNFYYMTAKFRIALGK